SCLALSMIRPITHKETVSSAVLRRSEVATWVSKYSGGNPVCMRPTPPWQKGIGEFFGQSSKRSEKENQASEEEPGCSGIGRRRRNILIHKYFN
uniref:PCNA-associated factor n=1 Tax=Varanus komodoensis TaxID=61221 RepID=A0A8D2JE60_VARKO